MPDGAPVPERPGGADDAPAGAVRAKRSGWRRQRMLLAGAASVFVHLVLLVVAGIYVLSGPAGEAASGSRTEAAQISESELSESITTLLSAEAPEVDTDQTDRLLSEAELAIESMASSSLELSDLSEFGAQSDGLSSGFEAGETAAGGSASFFGVEAQGSRFAFVLDISGSMLLDDRARLDRMHAELSNTLRGLRDPAEFAIYLYNEQAHPITDGNWWPATTRDRRDAINRVVRMGAVGGTEPLSAFEQLYRIEPLPDAIFFMTDGAFGNRGTQIANRIIALNSAGDVTPVIHCITFVEDQSASVMSRIARSTEGTYTHIPLGR